MGTRAQQIQLILRLARLGVVVVLVVQVQSSEPRTEREGRTQESATTFERSKQGFRRLSAAHGFARTMWDRYVTTDKGLALA